MLCRTYLLNLFVVKMERANAPVLLTHHFVKALAAPSPKRFGMRRPPFCDDSVDAGQRYRLVSRRSTQLVVRCLCLLAGFCYLCYSVCWLPSTLLFLGCCFSFGCSYPLAHPL